MRTSPERSTRPNRASRRRRQRRHRFLPPLPVTGWILSARSAPSLPWTIGAAQQNASTSYLRAVYLRRGHHLGSNPRRVHRIPPPLPRSALVIPAIASLHSWLAGSFTPGWPAVHGRVKFLSDFVGKRKSAVKGMRPLAQDLGTCFPSKSTNSYSIFSGVRIFPTVRNTL